MTNDQAVEWMRDRGLTSYSARRAALRVEIRNQEMLAGMVGLIRALACRKTIAALEAEYEAVGQEAFDRYDDWRTDPLE